MTVPRFLSLAYLTVSGATPPIQVATAAETGFQGVGLRVSGGRPGDAIAAIGRDQAMLRETERVLAASGLKVLDVEVVRITPQWRVADEAPTFEWAARLGAAHVLVLSQEPEEARTVDAFVAVCRAAAAHGLRAVLEFAPFTGVKTLSQALHVLERADQPNAGLLVDSLHLARSGAAPTELRSVPPALLHYAQLCDARAAGPAATSVTDTTGATGASDVMEALRHEALFDRLLPGEGELPLVDVLQVLPARLPISVEAPCRALADEAPVVRARRAAETTRRLLDRVDG